MSIVVTCSCTRTYRLPDRYAGKRCRCRDCGRKIEVPAVPAADEARAGKRKSKAERRSRKDEARRTTRRLSSQEQEILGERRRLRRSKRTRPLSESMHHLTPLTLSGDLAAAPPRSKKKAAAADAVAVADAPPRKKGKGKASRAERGAATTRRPTTRRPAKDEPVKGRKANRRTTKATRAVEPPARGKREAAAAGRPERGKAEPRRSTSSPAARRRSREDDEAPRQVRKPSPYKLPVLIGVAGVLCLGIGLVIGGLFASGGSREAAAPALTKRLADIDALKANRQWAAAEAEVKKLEAELQAAGDTEGLARLRAASASIKKLAALSGIEDEETKVLNLVTYAADPDASVRLGVAHELRPLAEGSEDAQRALAALARDDDPRVAEVARHALVQAGGPLAVPFLAQVIEETAASGHKLGDVALERALELSDPSVVPVLVTALKHRAGAPAGVLVQILSRLEEYADPSVKDAVTPFTTHADERVSKAAKAVLDAIG